MATGGTQPNRNLVVVTAHGWHDRDRDRHPDRRRHARSECRHQEHRLPRREVGHTVLGIRRGWEGLTHVGPAMMDPDYLRPLDRINTRTIEADKPILHTSRTNPADADGRARWMDDADRARRGRVELHTCRSSWITSTRSGSTCW